MVVAVVVAVFDEPDGVVAAPEVRDPIPSPNPNVPPATPSPSMTLLKGLFISDLLLTKQQILPIPNVYVVLLPALEHGNIRASFVPDTSSMTR